MGEWYYIGHYGQLGPLTKEQMEELVEGGVILHETYVWRTGMAQWQTADTVPELKASLQMAIPFAAPPPPPMYQQQPKPAPPMAQQQQPQQQRNYNPYQPTQSFQQNFQPGYQPVANSYNRMTYAVRSDKSRTWAGVMQIFPGAGRIYLGYYAYGTIQMVLGFCTGVLWLWSIIDGIIILTGGVQFDGFGRVLGDS
ncbi:MAG TPA: GYF domain-containing protein [Fimbriimonadaceae bacterium]